EMGFALMAVNLRKYTAINNGNGIFSHKNKRKKGCIYLLLIKTTFFVYLGLVMSQHLFHLIHWFYYYVRTILPFVNNICIVSLCISENKECMSQHIHL